MSLSETISCPSTIWVTRKQFNCRVEIGDIVQVCERPDAQYHVKDFNDGDGKFLLEREDELIKSEFLAGRVELRDNYTWRRGES